MKSIALTLLLLAASYGAGAQSPALPSSFSEDELVVQAQAFLKVADKKERLAAETALHAGEFLGYVAGYLDAKASGLGADLKLAQCVRGKSLAQVARRAATIVDETRAQRAGSARFEIAFAIATACRDDVWNGKAAVDATGSWKQFADNDRLVAYYQPQETSSSGTRIVWVMYDYKADQKSNRSGRRYRSQKGQQEMDCAQARSRTVFFTWHSERMGEDPVVYTGNSPQPWEPNSPASVANALASALCTQR
jgi:hypothetical protein